MAGPHHAYWLARGIAQHRIPRTLYHGSGHLALAVEIGDHRRPQLDGAVAHLSSGPAERDPPAPWVVHRPEPDKPARLPDRDQPVAAIDHEELAISRRACPQQQNRIRVVQRQAFDGRRRQPGDARACAHACPILTLPRLRHAGPASPDRHRPHSTS
jgi:hypothetical protein